MELGLVEMLLVFDEASQTMGLVPLLEHELGDLEFHEHWLIALLHLNSQPLLLDQLGQLHNLAVPLEQEVAHYAIVTEAQQSKLSFLLAGADVPEVELGLLLEDQSEFLLDLLTVIVEEAVVRALAVEKLGEHQAVVGQVHDVLVFLANR